MKMKADLSGNYEINLEEGWRQIELAIEKVWDLSESEDEATAERIVKSFTKMEQVEAYTICYRMCIMREYRCHDQLYAKFKYFVDRYIKERFLPYISSKKGDDLLNAFAFQLEVFQAATKMLRKFFSYLDRHPTDKTLILSQIVNEKLKTIWNFLPNAFFDADIDNNTDISTVSTEKGKEKKLAKPKNSKSVDDVIMDLILRERGGKSIQQKIITHYIQSLRLTKDDTQYSPLTTYAVRFEKPFLRETREYYRRKGMRWSVNNENDKANFMKLINQTIENEQSKSYVPPITRKKIVNICHLTLLCEWIFAANGLQEVRSHLFSFVGNELILNGLERISMKKRKRNKPEVIDRERSERIRRERRNRRNRLYRVLRANGPPLHIYF
uniref:Cullin N-terminal domain-containing protein n=1 Tax=Aplanochytrium stocchinoi TaxID=215587 RepID=A0A7S3PMZ4_9STRA|mmetsp:Transcript_34093/g.42092  ORF Transcript_34093/g.42092 Transcript_34093/m.42092 type:complete len:384 (+) Transcript_34093:587-1738(+)